VAGGYRFRAVFGDGALIPAPIVFLARVTPADIASSISA